MFDTNTIRPFILYRKLLIRPMLDKRLQQTYVVNFTQHLINLLFQLIF